jgi:hypothetical protein
MKFTQTDDGKFQKKELKKSQLPLNEMRFRYLFWDRHQQA